MDRPYTAPEAAEILNYHPKHMLRLLKAGTVKGEKAGGRWLISREEVERIKALHGPGGRLPKEPKQS